MQALLSRRADVAVTDDPETLARTLAGARKWFFKQFNKRWPTVKRNDLLRYAILSQMLRKRITGTGHWTIAKYERAAEIIEALADAEAADILARATPDALASVTAEAKRLNRENRRLMRAAPVRRRNIGRLQEIEEGLRQCGGFRKREHGVAAELLREVYDLAVESGDDPLSAVAEMLRAADADINLAKAERWIQMDRLAPAAVREQFPSLTWTHLETACFACVPEGQTLTGADVYERLKTAADNGLSCAGFFAWLKRDGPPPPDQPTPAQDVERRLCAGLPLALQQAIRERLPEISALYTFRPRVLPR
jgi:hypothetical protein